MCVVPNTVYKNIYTYIYIKYIQVQTQYSIGQGYSIILNIFTHFHYLCVLWSNVHTSLHILSQILIIIIIFIANKKRRVRLQGDHLRSPPLL